MHLGDSSRPHRPTRGHDDADHEDAEIAEIPEIRSVKLAAIAVEGRVRKSMGDIDALVQSIADVGLLQPVGLVAAKPGLSAYRLVFGERRVRAAERLKLESIPALVFESLNDAVRAAREHVSRAVQRTAGSGKRLETGRRMGSVRAEIWPGGHRAARRCVPTAATAHTK
jgi:hypothetical protein